MPEPEYQREFVCRKCVEDEALAKVVDANLEAEFCDYCEAESTEPIAALTDSVAEHMEKCIHTFYTDAVNELPWDSEESVFAFGAYETWEILDNHNFCPEIDGLLEDILDCMPDHKWCRINHGIMSEGERLSSGWELFANSVKHQRRYTFWSMGDPYADPSFPHPDDRPVGKMLGLIEKTILDHNLLKPLASDIELWRVRVHKSDKPLANAADFAAPPVECATLPNRMSPSGISMFYGAADWQTACREVIDPENGEGHSVSGGAFKPVIPMLILDLCDLPPMPSFWESGDSDEPQALKFLHHFVRELSKSIDRDERRQHIDYVPTQVFSEFIRYQMMTPDNAPIRGIVYPSSRNGRRCYVMFFDYHNCIGSKKVRRSMQALRFDDTTLRSKTVADEVASWM